MREFFRRWLYGLVYAIPLLGLVYFFEGKISWQTGFVIGLSPLWSEFVSWLSEK